MRQARVPLQLAFEPVEHELLGREEGTPGVLLVVVEPSRVAAHGRTSLRK